MYENPSDKRRGRIADYLPLIRAADGLTLSQVCAISALEPTTIQNWIKRGYVPHPVMKKYHERHLARILLIAQLRESMQIDRVGELLRYINGDTDDEGDDIIPETELYDLFCEIAQELEEHFPDPDRVGEFARSVAVRYTDGQGKIQNTLAIMAHTYMANLSKRHAEELFQQVVGPEE